MIINYKKIYLHPANSAIYNFCFIFIFSCVPGRRGLFALLSKQAHGA